MSVDLLGKGNLMSGQLRTIKLSRQEEQVLLLSMSGLGDREVGEALGLSTETIRTYWKRIRRKFEGSTRAEIIAQLAQRGVRAELEAQQIENELLLNEIAKRKQAEAQVRVQLDLFKSITEGTVDSIFLLDHDGRVTFANPAATATFGWKTEELVGKILHDLLHHHHADGTPYPIEECPLHQVFRSGQVVRNFEDQYYHKDGRPIQISCSNAPMGDASKGAVLIVRDITEQRAAATALRDSELRYRSLYEQTMNPILLVDFEGQIGDANPAATQVLGYDREHLVSATLQATLFRHDPDKVAEILAIVRQKGLFQDLVSAQRVDGNVVPCIALVQPARGGPGEQVWIRLDHPEGRELNDRWRNLRSTK